MTKDDVIERLAQLLDEIEEYGVPDGMTDKACFEVVVCIEGAIEKAKEDED